MAREQRNYDGALFKNDRKTADNHPDYTGSAVIDGVEYWVSAWVKTSQAGTKFFSMAYKPKEGQGAAARSAPGAQRRGSDSYDDFLPD
jgi:uncharacterized protein (DUF736 family)